MRLVPAVTAFWMLTSGVHPASLAQTPPGIDRTVLVDNESVLVARLEFAPGAREEPHTHPFPAVVVQITEARVDMLLGDERETRTYPTGHAWFIPAEITHAAVSAHDAPFRVTTVAIKQTRPPVTGPAAPAADLPPGITRRPVFEHAEARVARVAFEPGARETVHSHEYDLVVVQLTAGRLEVLRGDQKVMLDLQPGDVVFLPRREAHAVSNAGSSPLDLMSVAIR